MGLRVCVTLGARVVWACAWTVLQRHWRCCSRRWGVDACNRWLCLGMVFAGAIFVAPDRHVVHAAAARMLDDFEFMWRKANGKLDGDLQRKAAHECSFCQGEMCALCGDKCLRFDAVAYGCDCCGDKIRRGMHFYRNGAGNRWCIKCVSNGGLHCMVGGVKPPPQQQQLKARDVPAGKACNEMSSTVQLCLCLCPHAVSCYR